MMHRCGIARLNHAKPDQVTRQIEENCHGDALTAACHDRSTLKYD